MKRAIALILALVVTACGTTPAPTGPAASAGAAPSAAAATAAPVVLSGEITLYTAAPANLAPELAKQFTAKTGVKVNLFQGDTGAILAKLEAEKARPQADVLVLADWAAGLQMSKDGALLPYLSPEAATVPAQFQDPGKAFVAQGMSAVSIVYNTDKVTTPPTDWDDLLRPEWKDKLTMPDPAASGSAYDFVSTLIQQRGDDAGWRFFTGLKANGIVVPGTNAQAQTPVTAGSKWAVVGAVDHTTYDAIDRGEKLKIVYPASGTVLAPRPLVILKTAQNPNAAKAFVDFVLSKEGQQAVAQQWVVPARSDVPVREKRTAVSAIKIWSNDYTVGAARRAEIVNRFTTQITK